MLFHPIPRQLVDRYGSHLSGALHRKTPPTKPPRGLHFRHDGVVPHRGPSDAVVYARDMVFKTLQQMCRTCW